MGYNSDTKPRAGFIKRKVTADLVLDLYLEAKKKRGKNREEMMEQVKLLSKNLGSFLVKEDE